MLASAGLLAALATATPRVTAYLRARTVAAFEQQAPPQAGGTPMADPDLGPPASPGYEGIIEEASRVHGISAELIRAVIQTESRFDALAVSPAGALGLMQLMPRTAHMLDVSDPMDPRQNVLGGTKYLSMLLERFDGNVALALAGYNAGPTVVARHKGIPPYGETRGYVRKIHRLVADTGAAFHLPKPASTSRKARVRQGRRSRRVVVAAASRRARGKAAVRGRTVAPRRGKAAVRAGTVRR